MGESPQDNAVKGSSRSKSRKRRPNKNPFVNYLLELKEQQENKNVTSRELFKLAGERWRNMSEQERAPYRSAAKEAQDKDPKVKKPKGDKKGISNKNTPKGKKSTKKRACCSRCGHRHGSPTPEDSVEPLWDKEYKDNDSISSKSRSRSRSRSNTKSDSLTQDDSPDYFTDDTTTTF